MARTKPAKTTPRKPSLEKDVARPSTPTSSDKRQGSGRAAANGATRKANGRGKGRVSAAHAMDDEKEAGALQLIVAVAGIYGSFLTWGYLQEKLTTTPHGPPGATELFKYPVFLNTIQSTFAATTGAIYLYFSTGKGKAVPPIFPSRRLAAPLLLVALTTALASPFGYASLAHIDYVTFLLAKSCKLLPVMFLHITLFRKRFPLYKYMVVAAVTAGVSIFTLHGGKKGGGKKHGASETERNVPWGMLLLSINLLFDGLTNSVQDYIFSAYQPYSGPQMMCANNLLGTLVTGAYLTLSPWLVHTGIGEWLGMDITGSAGELTEALSFLARHPSVWTDVLGFAICGAVGQVFIFYTLATFSSVLLVTINVTRKMVTMILSVMAFGHKLTDMQYVGVALVFAGIGSESFIARRQKLAKEEEKRRAKAVSAKAE